MADRTTPFALIICLLGLLLPAASPQSASAQQAELALRPCGERVAGQRRIEQGNVLVVRISPGRGTSCQFNMSNFGRLQIDEMRVLHAPKAGKLVSARPNRIVYAAGAKAGQDAFAFAIRGKSLNREGWAIIEVQIRIR